MLASLLTDRLGKNLTSKIEITYFGKNMVIPRLSEQNLDTSNIFSENWSLVSWASRLILYLQTNS
jgi:hypothetical protein